MRGSTHYGVDVHGVIGQFVGLESQPIANGAENGATAAIVRENPNLSANSYSLSIEHLDGGVPGAITDPQFEASIWLGAWLWQEQIAPHAATTGAVLGRSRVLGHYEFAPLSRPRCPSWPEARFAAYIAGMRARLEAPVPKPPVVDWRARYYALVNEIIVWQQDDAAGAELRRTRLYEVSK